MGANYYSSNQYSSKFTRTRCAKRHTIFKKNKGCNSLSCLWIYLQENKYLLRWFWNCSWSYTGHKILWCIWFMLVDTLTDLVFWGDDVKKLTVFVVIFGLGNPNREVIAALIEDMSCLCYKMADHRNYKEECMQMEVSTCLCSIEYIRSTQISQ